MTKTKVWTMSKNNQKSDRYELGAFYTPSQITDYIAKRAIDARLLDVFASRGKNIPTIDEAIAEAGHRDLKLLVKTLADLTVLDPACGEGAFLLSCLEHLAYIWAKCLSRAAVLKGRIKHLKPQTIRRTIILNNLYGVDLDEKALSRCKKALCRAAGLGSSYIEAIEGNIRPGNSLLGYVTVPPEAIDDPDKAYLSFLAKSLDDPYIAQIKNQTLVHWSKEFSSILANGGFDIIIGNPPYGDRALSDAERASIKASYSLGTTTTDERGKGSVNPSSVFFERSYDILAQGGQLAFIVPASVARVREFQRTRRFLMDHMTSWHMVDEGSPFKGITLEMMSILAKKGAPPDDLRVELMGRRPGINERQTWHIPASVFRRYDRFIFYWDEMFERLTTGAQPGLITSRRGPTFPKEVLSSRKDKFHSVPLLVSGKAIQRYRLVQGEFTYAKEEVLRSQEALNIQGSTLLIATRIMDHYRVAVKPPGLLVGDNVARLQFDPLKATPEALCVILNSSLMHFIVRRYLFNESRLTMFLQSVAEATPVKLPSDMSVLNRVGKYMLALGEGWPETRSTMEELDRLVADPLVYELYLSDGRTDCARSVSAFLPQEPHKLKAGPALLAQDLLSKVSASSGHRSIVERIYSDPVVKQVRSALEKWEKE